MTRPEPCHFRCLALAAAAFLLLPLPARADDPAALAQVLRRAEECEARGRWQQAADLYDRAVRRLSDTPALREKWRRAEARHSLSRRYHDASFRRDLLALSETDALAILAETIQKIQTHHVAESPYERFAAAGRRQLALALEEPAFVEANVAAALRPRAMAFRAALAAPAAPAACVADVLTEARRARALLAPLGVKEAAPALEFVHAACEALDPYSAHLSPDRLRDLYALIDGNFVGLGVEVRGEESGLRIANVLPESPAAEAELGDGDVIVEVDGKPLAGLAAEEAANTLQGPPESAVRLRLRRGPRELAATLRRREVVVRSVPAAEYLDAPGGLAYVRIAGFQKSTLAELQAAVARLQSQGKLAGLALDLRGNPGGLLDVAVQVAGQFVAAGTLVETRGAGGANAWRHDSSNPAAWKFPVAVLVDADSASAAEIVAGALQDHGRGIVVGERTYGKGSVQSIFPLQAQGTGLRLTTAKFFSPKGRAYEGLGVTPDVAVARGANDVGDALPLPRRPSLARDPQLRAGAERLRAALGALAAAVR